MHVIRGSYPTNTLLIISPTIYERRRKILFGRILHYFT
nr:MAG TPA: hypothetical protein [Caudoviricetes sp.]